jgi:hypothetical protein
MTILDLWMPILASAVLVFVLSAMVWMVFPWHKTDFRRPKDESSLRAALSGYAPGFYLIPYHTNPKELADPEVAKKYEEGPQAYVTVIPNGMPNMGPKLILSFVYYLLVGVLCAYFVSRTAGPDADYLEVFRIAGTTAFAAYGIAYVQESIWFGRPWSLTAKGMLDGLLYGLVTGGAFGWLAG